MDWRILQNTKLLQKIPITDYLYWYRKVICNAIKDYDCCKVALQRSLEYKTDYTNTYLEMGLPVTKLKWRKLIFTKAIAIEPNSHIGYNGIAEVNRIQKRYGYGDKLV